MSGGTRERLVSIRASIRRAWRESSRSSKLKLLLAVLLTAALCVGLSVALKLGLALRFLKWMAQLGPWEPVVMIAGFVVAAGPIVFLFAVLAMASGFLFKELFGMAVVVAGVAIGSSVVFLLSRFVFRKRVKDWIANGNPLFKKLDLRIKEEGWKLALMLRLASMPYGAVNVFLGVTKLPFLQFFFTSVVGEGLVSFGAVVVGSSLHDVSQIMDGGHWPTQRIVLVVVELTVALGVMIGGMILMRRIVRETMRETLEEEAGDADFLDEEFELEEFEGIDGDVLDIDDDLL